MRRECRERFPRHQLQRKPLVGDPEMHHDTCVTHVPWWMSGSLTRSSVEHVSGIPGACATRNFAYLARGPWVTYIEIVQMCLLINYMIYWYYNIIETQVRLNCSGARACPIWLLSQNMCIVRHIWNFFYMMTSYRPISWSLGDGDVSWDQLLGNSWVWTTVKF